MSVTINTATGNNQSSPFVDNGIQVDYASIFLSGTECKNGHLRSHTGQGKRNACLSRSTKRITDIFYVFY